LRKKILIEVDFKPLKNAASVAKGWFFCDRWMMREKLYLKRGTK
jgi:hypothetical protein